MILLDGGLKAPAKYKDQKTIIKGDEKVKIIALASIIAKVSRDRHMRRLAKKFPDYGFEIHKGYGTRAHYRALHRRGLSPLHRRSFLSSSQPHPAHDRAAHLLWVAGMLYRHSRFDAALSHVTEARQVTDDPVMLSSLDRLERQIHVRKGQFVHTRR